MAKTRIAKKRKKRKEKKGHPNSQAPLCALGEVVRAKEVFEPIHQGVSINQKTVVYRPTDKLVLTVVGILSGAQNLSELNTELRPDKVLLESFGYSRCAEQSVIQQTLDAASETTVAAYEALSLRKYRKSGFVAQQVLVLLSQLAHNLLIWFKEWVVSALSASSACEKEVSVDRAKSQEVVCVRGFMRLRRDVLSVSGKVYFKGRRVVGIRLTPLHPLIHCVTTALEALFQSYNIRVSLDKN